LIPSTRLLFRTYRHTKKRNLLISARKIWNWVCIFFSFYLVNICLNTILLIRIRTWLSQYFLISGDEDEVKDRENKQEYNLLCDWIKQQLGDNVAKVQVSKRLSSSPCVLVSGKFGWSANMERLRIDFK
jgi:hypothetical protein